MKKLITQHRRGTNAEWEATSETPRCGEIVVEKGVVPKLKVGDGVTPYPDLPYITDEVQRNINAQADRIDTQTLRIDQLVAGTDDPLEGSWEAEVQDIRTIDGKTYPCAGDAVRSIYDNVKDLIGESIVEISAIQ